MVNLHDICKRIEEGEETENDWDTLSNLSTELNKRLGKTLQLTKEEVANGHYKALSPVKNHFEFNDNGCEVTRLNYWDDKSYIAYQTKLNVNKRGFGPKTNEKENEYRF